MGPDDATDVAKALAAFGAPSIRYHSFGQGQVKPSSVVLPRLGLAPLGQAANPAPAPPPARAADPVLSLLPTAPWPAELPTAPRPVGPVLRPAATPPMAVPLTPTWLAAPPPDLLPLDVSRLNVPPPNALPLDVPPPGVPPLDAPMPPMPAFRRTPDPGAAPRSILSRAVASPAPARHGPVHEPSAGVAMTLRALLATDKTVSEGLPFSAGQTLPTGFAVTRLSTLSPSAPSPSAPSPSAPSPSGPSPSGLSVSAPAISIKINAMPKLAVLPLLGRSAPAGQPGQSLAAIFAFLASDPMPGENSSFL